MSEIDYEERNLVKTKRGTLPILITCPHNGEEQPPGVNERKGTNLPYGCQFKKDADENTFNITDGVAKKIFAITNEYPYVVMFNGHRKYIDVNREKKCGCEQFESEKYFNEYHSTISQFAQEIRTNNACKKLVLLFDIHGKDNKVSEISIGTRNKSTIQPLVRLNPGWGWDYKFGLIYLFIKRGYKMYPGSPCQEDDPEFLGGYTVKEHGGWQFEIAKSKRDPGPGQDKLINDLGDIIYLFHKHNCT